eukprot:11061528-Lingulodinium_polyedra.AAC.1
MQRKKPSPIAALMSMPSARTSPLYRSRSPMPVHDGRMRNGHGKRSCANALSAFTAMHLGTHMQHVEASIKHTPTISPRASRLLLQVHQSAWWMRHLMPTLCSAWTASYNFKNRSSTGMVWIGIVTCKRN